MQVFFKSCFGRLSLFFLLIPLLIIATQLRIWYETRIIAFYPNHLDRYKEAQIVILKNYPLIEKSIQKEPWDSIRHQKGEVLLGFAKHTLDDVLKQRDSHTINQLWDERLMDNDLGKVLVSNGQNIKFEVKQYGHGIYFSNNHHYIIYAPKKAPEKWIPNKERYVVLKNIELEKNWFYTVIREKPE